MSFCKNCGEKLSNDAKFCAHCGTALNQSVEEEIEKVKTIYEGDVHKCPVCGEIVNSFTAICPACKHELRLNQSSGSIKLLIEKLNKISAKEYVEEKQTASLLKRVIGRDFKSDSGIRAEEEKRKIFEKEKEKYNLIINFVVANTKEDVLEFLLLANSNRKLNSESPKIRNAWEQKIKQVLLQAEISLSNDQDFIKIKENLLTEQSKLRTQKLIKLAMYVIGIIIIAASILIFALNTADADDATIKIGISAEDCEGQYYEDIIDLLENKGFSNIEAREDGRNIFHKSDTVKSIIIDGKDDFSSFSKFSKDAKIIILYYS